MRIEARIRIVLRTGIYRRPDGRGRERPRVSGRATTLAQVAHIAVNRARLHSAIQARARPESSLYSSIVERARGGGRGQEKALIVKRA